MSENLQSLPISGELAEEKPSTSEGAAAALDSVQIKAKPTDPRTITSPTFDDSVFIALRDGAHVAAGNAVHGSRAILGTVEVTLHPANQSLLQDDGEGCTHFFPTTVIAPDSTVDGEKVFLQSTLQNNGKPVVYLNPTEDLEMKKARRKRSAKDSEAVSDAEKEIYMSVTNADTLPITCKKNHAILYKAKLGSAKKGKCVKFEGEWYTPSEFENKSGLEMSKDWKRSLRYAGRSIQQLINKGLLRPHASTCMCAVCSDDQTVAGPIRYFTPNIRKKRRTASSLPVTAFTWPNDQNRPNTAPLVQPATPHQFVLPMPQASLDTQKEVCCDNTATSFPSLMNSADTTYHPETEALMEAISQNNTAEKRLWEELEERASSMMDKISKLQESITLAKAESENKRNDLLKQIHALAEKQKREIPDFKFVSGLTSPIGLKKSIDGIPVNEPDERMDEDNHEDITEICRACGSQAVSECTGCHKATYCSTECQEKDWHAGHRNTCRGLASQNKTSDKSESFSFT